MAIAKSGGRNVAFKVARMREAIMEDQDELITRRSDSEDVALKANNKMYPDTTPFLGCEEFESYNKSSMLWTNSLIPNSYRKLISGEPGLPPSDCTKLATPLARPKEKAFDALLHLSINRLKS